MAFKTTSINFVNYKELKPKDIVVTGWYKRSEQATGVHSKDGQLNYIFETENGDNVGLYHSGYLATAMQNIEIGQLTQVVFLGLQDADSVKKGMNPARLFEVLVDTDADRKTFGVPIHAPSMGTDPVATAMDDM